MPVVDGVVFTKHPVLLMREGKSATVPITLVTNAREGILEISGEVQKNVSLDTSADFISIMRRFVSVPKSFAAKVRVHACMRKCVPEVLLGYSCGLRASGRAAAAY